jgi:hypothetical protein
LTVVRDLGDAGVSWWSMGKKFAGVVIWTGVCVLER